MNNDKCRVFIGLKLSGYLVNTIPMIKSTIEDKKKLINWINGRSLHLTLSFMGNIAKPKIDQLQDKLNHISKFNSFDLNVNGTGAFPSFEKPRVLWLDIQEGRDELADIQSTIDKIANPFKEDEKNEKFIPHVTIGRIKNVNKNINLDLSAFSNTVYSDIQIPVKTIYLFRSQLLESGVEYSIISKYSLK